MAHTVAYVDAALAQCTSAPRLPSVLCVRTPLAGILTDDWAQHTAE